MSAHAAACECHKEREAYVLQVQSQEPETERKGLIGMLQKTASILLCTLREIFDENAYARFLVRRGMKPSRAAYEEFLQETRRAQERRVRCC